MNAWIIKFDYFTTKENVRDNVRGEGDDYRQEQDVAEDEERQQNHLPAIRLEHRGRALNAYLISR